MQLKKKLSAAVIIALASIFIMTACTTLASKPASAVTIVGSGVFVSATGERMRANYRSDSTVQLTFADGSIMTLDQAVSGSGTRYVAGNVEWWEHQGEATFSVDEKPIFVGKLVP